MSLAIFSNAKRDRYLELRTLRGGDGEDQQRPAVPYMDRMASQHNGFEPQIKSLVETATG
jgi:hypothetical protein